MLISIQEFAGRFHPALVHLPIGILILAFLLQWVARKNKSTHFHRAITISLLAGMISAIASCITGYLLSLSGDYDDESVSWHQWMGISTAIISVLIYYLYKKEKAKKWQWPAMIGLFCLIIITGHLGGSLTHGSGYITQPLTGDTEQEDVQKPIPDVQEAMAYTDIIQPLLQNKCYSCHNAKKKKGGLRMDDSTRLMKGGEDGVVIVAGNTAESEMIKRLLLPREDDDHMPPKEKPQLNDQEIALLHWWIATGASFGKKVKELQQPEKIQPVLLSLQNDPEKKSSPDIPLTPVSKADEAAVKALQDSGVVILPVAQNSNYLLANFVTIDSITMNVIRLLLPVKEQLVWLKIGNVTITDSALLVIGQCKNITRLQLNNTNITDNGLAALKTLQELRYLNLVGTAVTAEGVRQLAGLKKLNSLYLYQTNISKAGWQELQKDFPTTKLDSGGYVVPVLESDTTEVKYIRPGK